MLISASVGQRSATGPRQVNRKAQRLAERIGAHCNLVLGTSSLRLPAHRCLVSKGRLDNKQEVCPATTTFRRTVGKAPEKRRPRQGVSTGPPTKAPSRNHVWSWDFFHDRTDHGGPLKMVTLIDE